MKTITPGVYEHFKGKQYRVLGEVVFDGSRERGVLYVPLYGDGEPTVRTKKDFLEEIERDEYRGPRFRLVKEDEE